MKKASNHFDFEKKGILHQIQKPICGDLARALTHKEWVTTTNLSKDN
jgi:hypothetical protein